jgi:hypothetical protein
MSKWLVSGSPDGINWHPFGYAGSMKEARERAASCILKTQHTHVRIEPTYLANTKPSEWSQ